MYQVITGQDIKDLRTKYGLTQQEFATELGVSTRWLSDIEKNSRTPDKLYLRAIANLLTEIKANQEPNRD